MADKNSVMDLSAEEIKDLYSADKQLTKAIPKMVKGSSEPGLKEAFNGHLKETVEQVARLEKVAEILNIKPTGKKCVGMEKYRAVPINFAVMCKHQTNFRTRLVLSLKNPRR